MRILHVTLGNPHYHEGGLHRYCLDLINSQNKTDDVFILYPGSCLKGKNVQILKTSDKIYRINHSLPVSVTYGIDDPERYMASVKDDGYDCFLEAIKPDIVHVHSFMGIHKEFFALCKKKKIPLIFTTHDYYPLCFKCNLLNEHGELCLGRFNEKKCAYCNEGCGLDTYKQLVLQTEIYQKIKNFGPIRRLKKQAKTVGIKNASIEYSTTEIKEKKYLLLHNYYKEIIESFSIIHCNSLVSKKIYKNEYPELNYLVLPITHLGIKTEKHIKENKAKLRISYFGGQNPRKGFNQIKELISMLPNDNTWELQLFGGVFTNIINDPRVTIGGSFTEKDEETVWNTTDLLLFPSQWPESFGFSVLEALARGIPVICSDIAGASILLEDIPECVYNHMNIIELAEKISLFIDEGYYLNIQKKIRELPLETNMEKHVEKIKMQIYLEALNNVKKSIYQSCSEIPSQT